MLLLLVVVAVQLLLLPPLLLPATPLLTSFLLLVSSLATDPLLDSRLADDVLPGLTLLLPTLNELLNELLIRACLGAGEQIATCAHAMPTFAYTNKSESAMCADGLL